MSSRIFLGGVPTAPDVQRIIDVFVASPGTTIPHEEIAALIDVGVKSSRFQTVTTAWRKRLFRERRLQIKSEGGSFVVLTPDECVTAATDSLSKIGRATGRTVVRVEAIEHQALSPERQAQHTLLRRHSHELLRQAQTVCKEIAGPSPLSSTVVRLAPRNDEGAA